MTKREPKNLSASVKSRLLNLARERQEEFNLLLIRYGIERLLYRISQSDHGNSFVLKGAVLFHLFADAPHRPTKDVDLLGSGSPEATRIENIIREIIEQPVVDDGLHFESTSVRANPIKEDQDYEGIRVTLLANLGSARIPLQVDIGFGDTVTPRPTKQSLPCLLDFDAPRLAVYPWETVIAEKFQALVELGMTNSRMKDFHDLYFMAREMSFNGKILAQAIHATFERRKTEIPGKTPIALTNTFVEDETVGKRWTAFVGKNRLDGLTLLDVTQEIDAFLMPLAQVLATGNRFNLEWKTGGPWT